MIGRNCKKSGRAIKVKIEPTQDKVGQVQAGVTKGGTMYNESVRSDFKLTLVHCSLYLENLNVIQKVTSKTLFDQDA